MNGTLAQNLMSLNISEQDRLFHILSQHADLLSKVIPNVSLLEYIATGQAINAVNDPTIRAYDMWKRKNN